MLEGCSTDRWPLHAHLLAAGISLGECGHQWSHCYVKVHPREKLIKTQEVNSSVSVKSLKLSTYQGPFPKDYINTKNGWDLWFYKLPACYVERISMLWWAFCDVYAFESSILFYISLINSLLTKLASGGTVTTLLASWLRFCPHSSSCIPYSDKPFPVLSLSFSLSALMAFTVSWTLVFFVLFYWIRVSICSSSWPGTQGGTYCQTE